MPPVDFAAKRRRLWTGIDRGLSGSQSPPRRLWFPSSKMHVLSSPKRPVKRRPQQGAFIETMAHSRRSGSDPGYTIAPSQEVGAPIPGVVPGGTTCGGAPEEEEAEEEAPPHVCPAPPPTENLGTSCVWIDRRKRVIRQARSAFGQGKQNGPTCSAPSHSIQVGTFRP